MSKSESQSGPQSLESVPQALVRTPAQVAVRTMRTRLWWLTGLCVVLAVALVTTSLGARGTLIKLQFLDGHGLKPGDTLRYRGIDIGSVQSIRMGHDLQHVEVHVLLEPGNESIAVEGSQFWIERARLRLGQVAGLDTVLGAKYISVIPGAMGAAAQSNFVGLESPLNIARGDAQDIRIQFPAGEGLTAGDTVRYRGISVGEVTYVELSETIDSVWVGVRLVGSARALARVGTHFWIERPRLDLTEVRGLETLVGGRYIAIQPTLNEAEPQTEFVGLAEPPPMPRRDGSLEIELDAPNRLGLVRGAPITYRGLEVGRISNVGLASDGATVKVTAVIDAEYSDLVRDNSKWWAVGGVKVDANLRGVEISIDSLSAWIRGGVAFSTPVSPGARVVTGHRFVLEPEPQPEWLDWQPRIPVGTQVNGQTLPRPVRVVASWRNSLLGLYRRRTIETWGVALSGNRLVFPRTFVDDALAANDEVRIEVAGQSFVLVPEVVTRQGALASLPLPDAVTVSASDNPVGPWTPGTVLLIVNPELSEPMAVDETRVAVVADGLEIAPGVPIAEGLAGTPVVNGESGQLVGLLVERSEGWMIATLGPAVAPKEP